MHVRLVAMVVLLAASFAITAAPAGANGRPRCHGQIATQVLDGPGALAFTAGDDVFIGSNGDDSFTDGEYGGTDYVCARGGNDSISMTQSDVGFAYGGGGDDQIDVYGGATGFGESGNDTMSAHDTTGGVYGGNGDDRLAVQFANIADGGSGNDWIGADFVSVIRGGAGKDYIYAGISTSLDCGSGKDTYERGGGQPTVTHCETIIG